MQILIVLAVAAVATANPYARTFVNPEDSVYSYTADPADAARVDDGYQFSYSVNDPSTGDDKEQVENLDGGFVQGKYSLLEPDGLSRRVVEYSANDATGFTAAVHNEPAAQPAGAVAPAVRTDVAVPAVPSAFRTHYVAYTPTTRISYQPAVRNNAYVPSHAVSSQTVSYTSRTAHPQPVNYQNQVATHFQAPAVAAVRTDIAPVTHTNYVSRIAQPVAGHSYIQPTYHNQYY